MEFEPAIYKAGFVSIKRGGIQRNGVDRLTLYPSALKTAVTFPFNLFFKGLDIPLYAIKDVEKKSTIFEHAITITYDEMGKEQKATIEFSRLFGAEKKMEEFYSALERAMPKKRVSGIRAEKTI